MRINFQKSPKLYACSSKCFNNSVDFTLSETGIGISASQQQELRQQKGFQGRSGNFWCQRGRENNCMNVSQRGNNAEVTLKEAPVQRETSLPSVARLVESTFGIMAELTFNVDHGYLEGLVRGMKAGILTSTDYHNLAQCDTLEGENIVPCCHFWNVSGLQLPPLKNVCGRLEGSCRSLSASSAGTNFSRR